MTDYERALAAGAQPKPMSDYDRALAAGARPKVQEKPPEEPGFFARAISTAAQGVDSLRAVGGDIISSRGAALLDPSKRHQLERGIGDVVTGGLANKAADWVSGKFDTRPSGSWFGGPESNLVNTAASDQAANPEYRTAGNIAGIAAPNPFGWAGKEAGAFLGGLAPKAIGKTAGATLGVAKGLLGYEASAVPMAATQAAVEGDNPIMAARRAATDPLGLTLSVAGGAAGGAGHGKANELRDPSRLSGRVLRDVKAAGGEINTAPWKEPVQGGVYESPEMTDLKKGRAGVNEAANNAQESMRGHNRQKLGTARSDYGTELDSILQENATKRVRPHGAYDALDKMEAENKTSDGKVIDASKARFVADIRALLTSKVKAEGIVPPGPEETPTAAGVRPRMSGRADAPLKNLPPGVNNIKISTAGDVPLNKLPGVPGLSDPDLTAGLDKTMQVNPEAKPEVVGSGRTIDAPVVRVDDMLKVKKYIDTKADWANPATAESRPYRELYKALATDAEAVDARIGPLNKKFGQTTEGLKDANDILYGKHKADIADREAASKHATLKLGRIGDDTQAATSEAAQLEKLRKMDPKYAEMLRLIEAKKAQERLRYGAPEVSTGMEKGQHNAAQHGARHVLAGALGLSTGHPLAIAPALALANAMQNPLAIDLRLKLPMAEAASRINPSKGGLAGMQVAREHDRKKNASRAGQLSQSAR